MTNILEVQNISKKFGGKQVLDHVSFTIPRGKIIGLVGPNGAGKSTIMKAVLGLYPHIAGSVTFDGQPLHSLKNTVLKKVGFLIENPAIYPFLTGYQHFQLYSSNADDINQVISDLHMKSYIHRKASHYSLGMKQKLGIALAMINQPELVILDEPMNGLDPQSNRDLRNLIVRRAKAGTTFIVSSHILSELAKIIDDVILINDGKLVLATTIEKLRKAASGSFVLQTNHNEEAQAILAGAKFESTIQQQTLLVNSVAPSRVTELLTILLNHGISITNIDRKHADIESIFVKMLDDSKSEVRA